MQVKMQLQCDHFNPFKLISVAHIVSIRTSNISLTMSNTYLWGNLV